MSLFSFVQAGAISDAPSVVSLLDKVLNFLLSIIGVLAIIALAVSSILYLTAAGNEKQIATAKKAFFFSVIGIIVALGALVIVSQIGDFFTP